LVGGSGRGARLRRGAGLLPRAWRLVRAQRSLWAPALVPAALAALCATSAAALVLANATPVLASLSSALPQFDAGQWYSWLWVGPAKALVWLLTYVLFGLLVGGSALLGLLVASLLSSPVLDELSRRVERIVSGGAVGDEEAFHVGLLARDAWSSLVNEAGRLALLLGVWLVLTVLGFLLPFGVALAPVAFAVVAVGLLPLQYAGFALDRRRVPFSERRAWLTANAERAVGFGGVAFALGLLPGINFLMLPVLVVAGTLFVLESPPAARGGESPALGALEERR